ncbi:hypothetical protein [Saccharopolyspora sp. NPDC050642]|uniref:CdiA C-terminal domain-containing protein n=1 Tax=Saccharopolyspora sp. NPDC050642 TaxID=3157099 RepID=UPI003400762F
MNDQTISGQAENLRLAADAIPLTDANSLCDAIETLRDQLAEILGTDNEIVSQAHHLAETAANIVRTLASLRSKIQDVGGQHHGNAGTHQPASTPNPTTRPQTPEKPYDRIPKPQISKPSPLPTGVTDDPETWPGRIEDNGTTDEQRFSPDEASVAKRLAQMGRNIVRRLPTSDRRTADATVNGHAVEFKTLQQKDGNIPTHKTVKKMLRNSQKNGGQSSDVIVDARRTDLTSDDAVNGLKAFVNAPGNENKLTQVRIWGKTFDFNWKRES